jgi:hypothetical protein
MVDQFLLAARATGEGGKGLAAGRCHANIETGKLGIGIEPAA